MEVRIEGVEYNIPSSLMEVTLGERIAFDRQYGKALREQLQKIIDMKGGKKVKVEDEEMDITKEMDFVEYHCSLACKSVSFFGKIPLHIVESTDIMHVLAVYHAATQAISQDVDFSADHQLVREFWWNDEKWVIAPPELSSNSKMSFGEFLDAKQWVKNTYEFSQQKWDALLGLCCVYFRREGEPYSKEMIEEGGQRYKLMETLPLQYALEVGFFLKSSIDFYLKIFHSSDRKTAESVAQS